MRLNKVVLVLPMAADLGAMSLQLRAAAVEDSGVRGAGHIQHLCH